MMTKSKSPALHLSAILLCLLCAVADAALAQSPSPSPATNAATDTAPTASPSPTPVMPKVTSVDGHLELDVIIRVEINHLNEWAATNDATKLVPYLNGRAIKGNYPEEIHAARNHVQFHLEMTADNKDIWIDLLGEPHGARKPVAFSVGPETESQFDTVFDQKNPLPLTVISPVYGVVAAIAVLLTLILLVWLGKKTNLIRESGACPVPGKLRPYNLGRTQMAFWFFLIYASYTVIWLITDSLDTITPSLLGLMGISAGTALGEALIDSGKDNANSSQLQEITAERQSLEQTIPDLQGQLNAVNAKTTLEPEDTANRDSLNKQLQDSRARLAQVIAQIQTLTPDPSSQISKGLLRDILSDGAGYSFHRFQIFAWTIILGIMFVSSVYNNLNMPEFSATLLGLMGLSSGTYIGFKFPEQK